MMKFWNEQNDSRAKWSNLKFACLLGINSGGTRLLLVGCCHPSVVCDFIFCLTDRTLDLYGVHCDARLLTPISVRCEDS